jgi:cell division protein ZapA
MSKAVDIQLLGKSYRIACPDGKEGELREAAQELSKRLQEVRPKAAGNTEHLAIMVALNLSYELLEERAKSQEYTASMDQRILSLQETIEQALLEHSPIKS